MIRPLCRAMIRKLQWIPAVGWYARDWRKFRRAVAAAGDRRFAPPAIADGYPCLLDRTSQTGFDRHYIYHPAWAARILAQTRPAYHADFSSSLTFCSIVSAFLPVRFYDYRPADLRLSNLEMQSCDLTKLPFETGSLPSVSCMHVIEHIGLGRYGDPIDPQGDSKAMHELGRVVAPGGSLLIVTPVGVPVIRFNAHRIYSMDMILREFPGFDLKLFTLIPNAPEDGGPIDQATPERVAQERFGCGCFWLVKRQGSAGQSPESLANKVAG